MRASSMSLLLCASFSIVACGGISPTPLTTSPSSTTPVSTAGSGTGTGGSGTGGTGSSVKGPFSPTGSMIAARANHTATLLPSGKVLITGGDPNAFQAPLASAELYDPSTGMFTPTGSMTTARTWGHTATLLANGTVLIAGGSDRRDTYDPITSAELYDPSTGKFTATGSMPAAQRTGPSTLLQDGRVFVAGDDYAAIYDPSSGTFAQAGAYVDATPVLWVTVNLLADGRVLLTGCTAQCTVGATELFNPKSGAFSTTGPMPGYTWGNENTATLLTDGRVLFVGNAENDGTSADAEVYDPAAGTFTSIGKALAPHEFAAAVRLTDGTVMITGGQLPGGNGSSSSDLYSPATGTFGSANMTTARHSHTATLLTNGTVLIVGGYSGWPTPTASAEIYDPSCGGCWDY